MALTEARKISKKLWRQKNKDKIREYFRDWAKKNPDYAHRNYLRNREKIILRHKKYYAKSSGFKKDFARSRVNVAVRLGKIKKEACHVCKDSKRPEAHHPDYSKPLEIIWLCKLHHVLVHKPYLNSSVSENQKN